MPKCDPAGYLGDSTVKAGRRRYIGHWKRKGLLVSREQPLYGDQDVPLLKSPSDKSDYSVSAQDRQTDPNKKRSNIVPVSRSKIVPARRRRSGRKDAKIIEKIRDFDAAMFGPRDPSLVAHSHPLQTSQTSPQSATPKPANDNSIPVWSLTDDVVKVFSATVALQISETVPVPFVFNLTPEAIANALESPAGIVDALKRSLDKALAKASVELPYWFCVDIDAEKRLHVQGAFLPAANTPAVLAKIRAAMKSAWEEWQGAGKHLQLWTGAACDDGWATYCMRNQRAVAKIIGARTFTITNGLRREAEDTYSTLRRIMRSGDVSQN